MARAKRKLPAKPAGFVFPQHRDHFCPVIRYPNTKPPPPTIHTPQKPHGPIKRHQPAPEHKAPAADNTHPTKTSRLGQTAPTDTRTQKNPLPLRTPPAVSAFSKKTAALPKCHSSAPTTAGRRTTPPHTT